MQELAMDLPLHSSLRWLDMFTFSDELESHFFSDPAIPLPGLHLLNSSTVYGLIPIIIPLSRNPSSASAPLTDIPAHLLYT